MIMIFHVPISSALNSHEWRVDTNLFLYSPDTTWNLQPQHRRLRFLALADGKELGCDAARSWGSWGPWDDGRTRVLGGPGKGRLVSSDMAGWFIKKIAGRSSGRRCSLLQMCGQYDWWNCQLTQLTMYQLQLSTDFYDLHVGKSQDCRFSQFELVVHGGFHKWVPQNGWFISEYPIKMDETRGTTICGNQHMAILHVGGWVPLKPRYKLPARGLLEVCWFSGSIDFRRCLCYTTGEDQEICQHPDFAGTFT